MIFNIRRILFTYGLAMSFILSGCSEFLKSGKDNNETISIDENESCLKNLPVNVKKIFDSQAKDEDIDQMSLCLQATLSRFQSKFRGQNNRNEFNAEDISNIFNFFFKELKISKETAAKIVKLKLALIGGNENSISKADIEHFKLFLNDFNGEIKLLLPWIRIVTFQNRLDNSDSKEIVNFSEIDILKAFAQLKKTFRKIISQSYVVKTNYSFQDLTILAEELKIKDEKHDEKLNQFQLMKNILVGVSDFKSKDQYLQSIDSVVDGLSFYSLFQNGHFKFDIFDINTKERLIKLSKKVFELLLQSPNVLKNESIALGPLFNFLQKTNEVTIETLEFSKKVLFSGDSKVLTKQEISSFQAKSEILISEIFEVFKNIKVLQNSSTDKNQTEIAATLQSIEKSILKITKLSYLSIHYSLKTSHQIFEALDSWLEKSKIEVIVQFRPLIKELFDIGTFKTVDNILVFIQQAVEIYAKIPGLQDKSNLSERLGRASEIIANLLVMVDLKNDKIINLQIVLDSFRNGEIEKQIVQLKTVLKYLKPALNFTKINKDDLVWLNVFITDIAPIADGTDLVNNIDTFLKTVEKLLVQSEFYQQKIHTHSLIVGICTHFQEKQNESERVDPKILQLILKIFILDEPITNFEKIRSIVPLFQELLKFKTELSQSSDSKTRSNVLLARKFLVLLSKSQFILGKHKVLLSDLFELFVQAGLKIPIDLDSIQQLKVTFVSPDETSISQKDISDLLSLIDFFETHLQNGNAVIPSDKLVTSKMVYFLIKPINFKKIVQKLTGKSAVNIGELKDLILHLANLQKSVLALKNQLSIALSKSGFALSEYKMVVPLALESLRQLLALKLFDTSQSLDVFYFTNLIKEFIDLDDNMIKKFMAYKKILIGGNSIELTKIELQKSVNLLTRFSSLFFSEDSKADFMNSDGKMLDSLRLLLDPKNLESFANIFKSKENAVLADEIEIIVASLREITFSSIEARQLFDTDLKKIKLADIFSVTQKILGQIANLPVIKNGEGLRLLDVLQLLKKHFGLETQIFDQVMNYKEVVLGGKKDLLLQSELKKLSMMFEILNRNQQEIKILLDRATQTEKTNLESLRIEVSALKKILNDVLVDSNIFHFNIEFSELLKSFLQITGNQQLVKYQNTILSIHKLLIADGFDFSQKDFNDSVGTYVTLYQLAFLFQMNYFDLSITSKDQVMRTQFVVGRMIGLLKESPVFKKRSKLDLVFIDQVINDLFEFNHIPLQIDASKFLVFYKVLLVRIFSSNKSASIEGKKYLDSENINAIVREFELIKFEIDSLNLVFSKKIIEPAKGLSHKDYKTSFGDAVKQLNIEKRIDSLGAAEDFILLQREIHSRFPVLFQNKRLVISSVDQDRMIFSWPDAFRSAYTRSLSRLLIQGWGTPQKLLKSDGLQKWYDDFREFGLAMNIFDPRSIGAGARSYLEAELFTFSGNGHSDLDFFEVNQYVSMLNSGGGVIFSEIFEKLKENSCELNKLDPIGQKYLKRSCVLNYLKTNYKTHFGSYKQFVEYLHSGSQQLYFDDLISVATESNLSRDLLESSELKVMIMILTYSESLFTSLSSSKTMDLTATYNLSIEQLRQSYVRFENFAYSMAKRTSQDKLDQFSDSVFVKYLCLKDKDAEARKRFLARESFLFLIYNSRLPSESDISKVKCLSGEIYNFEGSMDRKKLLNTFKALKSVLASHQ